MRDELPQGTNRVSTVEHALVACIPGICVFASVVGLPGVFIGGGAPVSDSNLRIKRGGFRFRICCYLRLCGRIVCAVTRRTFRINAGRRITGH
jgi:hypothetical protein